jgi:precorrin-2 dehydrogenase/sirohydrochlorin ferrochelatase
MIPLLHDFTGERVLVVGGGPVGARKARRFAREAEVVVLSPTFEGDDGGTGDDAFGGAERVRAAVEPADAGEWLDRTGAALVVAATDDSEVNAAVERAARERGVLVNRADRAGERDPGSVVVPATARDGPVVAAVGTGGRSPALSRYLRREIEDTLAGAGGMAELTATLREEWRSEPADRRRAALRAVVGSDAVWKALDTPNANPRRRAEEVASEAGDPV